jgi:protein-S-isoprenylcysteine O-methyltransferase Ste14
MKHQFIGSLLVSLQFAALAALAFFGLPHVMLGQTSVVAWAALALSGVIGLWALTANRPGNFNIRPTPHSTGVLVQSGPYRWIRHPMYTAVLLFGAGCSLAEANTAVWLIWCGLAGVLLIKAVLEERWMLLQHPTYRLYQAHTKRFVPGLF